MEHQALSMAHQSEEEAHRLRGQSEVRPDHLKAQRKQQVSQAATYKAEIHALHTELRNITEKSELQAIVSARMVSMDASRPIVESEPEVLLNTTCPGEDPARGGNPGSRGVPSSGQPPGRDPPEGASLHLHRHHQRLLLLSGHQDLEDLADILAHLDTIQESQSNP